MPAKTRYDTIAVALMLDLQHRALVRRVWPTDRLRDYAIEPRTFEACEPVLRGCGVPRCGCEMQWCTQVDENPFELGAPGGKRLVAQIMIVELKQVEEDNRGRQLCGKCLYTRRCGVEAQRQSVKIQAAITRNDNLTIQNASLRQLFEQRFA